MIKNYIKVALRNLIKQKGYSFINILGLSLGITCCIILFIVVHFEMSYDNFHLNAERIYRVVTNFTRPEGMNYNQGAPVPMHEALKTEMADLDHIAIVRYDQEGDIVLVNNEQEKYKEEHVGFVNQDFLQIFQFEWLSGSKDDALTAPNQVVISRQLADKYFNGSQNALGQLIRLNNQHDLKISGVVERFPDNSDFQFNLLVSYPTVKADLEEVGEWGSVSSNIQHFILLPENSLLATFSQRLDNLTQKYLEGDDAINTAYTLQPLETIHFDTRYGNFGNRISGKETMWALMAIGLFMIVTACINFINLATAQAVKRSKEVGVRKVLGSSKFQLSAQFLGETTILTLISIIISIGLVEISLPYINQLMGLNLSFSPLGDPFIGLFLLSLLILVSLFSGFYPSIVLAGFKPVEAIKNKISSKQSGGYTLRRSLVVLQFVISQILIVGTIIVSSQLEYFKSKDLGFNKDAILTLPLPERDNNSLASLKNGLSAIPEVQNVSFCYTSPSSDSRWVSNVAIKGVDIEEVYADIKGADENYLETFGLELLAGRFVAKSDTVYEVVVNETFVRKFGFTDPNDAIGREVDFWPDVPVPIVGVVKDFHALSLRDEISPLLITTDRENYSEAGIKVAGQNLSQTLEAIEAVWSEVYPSYVYDYNFLDETINDFYVREARLSKLFQVFAGIAIFIGCLGLYGLVSFMAAQKNKEIGIRKVMGASVSNILFSFSSEFTKLVLMAFIIAAPISYYIMNSWLQDFNYRIEIGVGVFFLAVLASLAIAWITVGYKAVKASIANPIKALKSE